MKKISLNRQFLSVINKKSIFLILLVIVLPIMNITALDNVRNDTQAEKAWSMTDWQGLPVLGSGVRIAVIDSGIDWEHPSFYLPSTKVYQDITDPGTLIPNPGVFINISVIPYLDLDNDRTFDPNETLDYTRSNLIDPYGTILATANNFDPGIDYLFNDKNKDGLRGLNESFFLFNDTDISGNLSTGDYAYELTYPKIEKIWDTSTNRFYHRDVNLTDPLLNTEHDYDGHGTHIAGIIAGGHQDFTKYTGIAPNSTLLVAKVTDNVISGSYTESSVINAIDWAVIENVDIISISIAFFDNKFRDGTDQIDAKIDWAKSKGVFVVVAGGNYANTDTHATDISNSFSANFFDWTLKPFFNRPPNEEGEYSTLKVIRFTILWRSPHHLANFSIIMPDGTFINKIHNIPMNGPSITVNVNDTNDPGDEYIVTSELSNSSRGTMKHYIEIRKLSGAFIDATFSPPGTGDTEFSNPGYPSLANINFNDTGSLDLQKNLANQIFHLYISDDKANGNGFFTHFMNPLQISPDYTVTAPATSDSAIPVGAHIVADLNPADSYNVGNITNFSSRGPRIDGKDLPYITAPGEYIFSTSSKDVVNDPDYFYVFKSGTSMATPVVAGSLALMLQINPNLTFNDALMLLKHSATIDAYVKNWGTPLPNLVFGHGKLNISDLALRAYLMLPPSSTTTSSPSTITTTTTSLPTNTTSIPPTTTSPPNTTSVPPTTSSPANTTIVPPTTSSPVNTTSVPPTTSSPVNTTSVPPTTSSPSNTTSQNASSSSPIQTSSSVSSSVIQSITTTSYSFYPILLFIGFAMIIRKRKR
ncbi:MAG: S8 family serine peptidase [Candidatus Hodarchaeales archaeon]|jgi:subtilisin family serine protease